MWEVVLSVGRERKVGRRPMWRGVAIDLKVTTYNWKVVGVSLTGLCKPGEDARVGVPVCGLRHVHRSGKDVGTGVRVY